MDAHTQTIADILNGRRKLEIPYYQRSYVWDEPQWARFVKDMEMVSSPGARPYFIGSVILKRKDVDSDPDCGDIRLLIDGQQRMTTLYVYMKVLSLKLGKPGVFKTFLLASNDEEEPTIISLRHNHIDREPFERVLSLATVEKLALDEKGEIDKKAPQILRLYEYFVKEIDCDSVKSKSIKDNLLFVKIDVEKDEDEQQIFDTINSLGVKLTTTELLKNHFFDERNELDYETYWKPVFEASKELKQYWDREIVSGGSRNHLCDLFFSSFLNIKINDPAYKISAEDKVRFSRVDNLFSSYKEFLARFYANKMDLMSEIKNYAEVFSKAFKPDCLGDGVSSEPSFERINLMIFGMDFTTLLPYVLAVLVSVESDVERARIYAILESYLMRRLVCRSETRSYYQLFSSTLLSPGTLTADGLADFIREKEGEEKMESPTDDALETAVLSRQRTNRQNTAILYMLESKLRSSNHATELKGLAFYSLEHLLPRQWRKSWPLLDSEERSKNRDRVLGTLGNMAIIPFKLNTSISNSVWLKKLEGRPQKDGLRKCASGLNTMDPYLSLPAWDESEIEKRAQQLTLWMNGVWPRYL